MFCSSLEKIHEGHKYLFIDDAFTQSEAVAACTQSGSLAMADDLETFRVLWRLLNDSRGPSDDNHIGAWLDGKLDANGTWQCESNKVECGPIMPWTKYEPPRHEDEKCVLLWLPRWDGVAHYYCTRKMAAICEVK